jgi:hypothetical protein
LHKRVFDGMQERDNSIEFFGRKRRPDLCANGLERSRERGHFISEPVKHWVMGQDHAQRLESSAITPIIEQSRHFSVKIRSCH